MLGGSGGRRHASASTSGPVTRWIKVGEALFRARWAGWASSVCYWAGEKEMGVGLR